MLAGELVPDHIINEIVGGWVQHPDCRRGFLLDGYPRTLSQALYLDDLLDQIGIPQPTVIHIDVPEQALLKRIMGRRQCSFCNRVYNIYTQPPVQVGLCDYDEKPLTGRADDTEPALRERLRQYQATMEPVIRHYRSKKFNRIDGSDNPAMVLEAIESALGECAW
jgi:adenylate kinase